MKKLICGLISSSFILGNSAQIYAISKPLRLNKPPQQYVANKRDDDTQDVIYWLNSGIYEDAKRYVNYEVWDKGFWLLDQIQFVHPANFLDAFYSYYGNIPFSEEVVINHILYDTANNMDYYNCYLAGYYYWDLLYNEFNRLYNILYYSVLGSWRYDFNASNFYNIYCNFCARYGW